MDSDARIRCVKELKALGGWRASFMGYLHIGVFLQTNRVKLIGLPFVVCYNGDLMGR